MIPIQQRMNEIPLEFILAFGQHFDKPHKPTKRNIKKARAKMWVLAQRRAGRFFTYGGKDINSLAEIVNILCGSWLFDTFGSSVAHAYHKMKRQK